MSKITDIMFSINTYKKLILYLLFGQALESSCTSLTGLTWRTLNELSPSSTTSPSVLSTPLSSQEQWLRGLPQFPLTTIPRVNFKTFLVYSVFNVTIYAIPASWLFSQDGWLKQLGGIDYGCGVVQLFSMKIPI